MRRRDILAATLVALTMGTQAQVIESYQVRDAVTLRTPILSDSINNEGRKYETKNLLATAIGLNQENFSIYSASLDLNKEEWLQASDRDVPNWYQVCDFKGWNNSIIKSQGINDLPSNLLLDKNKRIIARNIRGQELIDKIKELTRKDKERNTSKQRK